MLATVSAADALLVASALVAVIAAAFSLGAWLARARRGALAAHAALFALALAAALLVRPAPGNWYLDVLPRASARFGPGEPLWQALLAATLPWSDATLFGATAVAGALAPPLLASVARASGLGWPGAIAAATLLALAPLQVRAAASGSVHVPVATAALAALAAWLRFARARRRVDAVLACALLPVCALTRPDALPYLGALALWSVAPPGAKWRAALRDAACFACAWGATAALTWHDVIRLADHPMLELAATRQVLPRLFAQYVGTAAEPPAWFSPVALVVVAAGLALGAAWRPRLVALVVLTSAASYLALGRGLEHEGLVGARYYLFVLAIGMLPGGVALDALALLVARAVRQASPAVRRAAPVLASAVAIAALAAATVRLGRGAYAYRYAFQDEYAFLATELARLPDGCTVYTLPTRVPEAFPRDLDCCLAAERSPLAARFPALRVRALPAEEGARVASLPAADACAVLYEGAVCTPLATSDPDFVTAGAYYARRCEAARSRHAGALLAEARVSPATTRGFFGETAPRVRLWRWLP